MVPVKQTPRALRPRIVVAAIGAAAVGVAACSLVLDSSSLRATDGGTDGGAPDGDGAASGDASGCDATFCDDFDLGALGARWTSIEISDSGTLSLGGPARSPPNALRAAVADAGAKLSRQAFLSKDFDTAKSVRCSFTIQPDRLPPLGQFADVFYVTFAAPGFVETDVLLSANQGNLGVRQDVFFSDGGCACPEWGVDLAPLPPSLWTRVVFETDFSTMKLFVEGAEVLSRAVTGSGPARSRVNLGVWGRGTAGTSVRIDDFACTVTP